jgi:hypothetical protein
MSDDHELIRQNRFKSDSSVQYPMVPSRCWQYFDGQAMDKPTGQRPQFSPVLRWDRCDSGPLKTSANLRLLRLMSLLILP